MEGGMEDVGWKEERVRREHSQRDWVVVVVCGGGGGGLSFGTDSRACVGVVRSVFLVVAVSSLLDQ